MTNITQAHIDAITCRNSIALCDCGVNHAKPATMHNELCRFRLLHEIALYFEEKSLIERGRCLQRLVIGSCSWEAETEKMPGSKHSHYHKPCPFPSIDVYRVLELFNVTNPSIAHALKKLLVAGGRGAGKDINKDIRESIESLERWEAMRREDADYANKA